MRRAAWAVAATLGSLGCAGDRPAAVPAATLRIAVQGDITGVYPDLRNESYSFAVNANVFEGLTRLGHDLGPEPALADAWANPDEHTWIFHLRPGVRFSDGTPVVMADVSASLRHAMSASTTRTLLAPIESIEAVAGDSLKIRTRYPCPVLLAHLAFAFVVPEAALASGGKAGVLGTGPFAVQAWTPGRELVLARNPQYRGARPDFESVRFLVTPDPAERLRALQAGDVDIADNVPTREIEALRASAALRVVSRPGLRVLFLVTRVDQPPFSDPRVREALDLAIDRDELVTRAMNGFGTPSAQLVPPPVLGFNPDIPVTVPDRERARRLLRDAGHDGGLSVRLEGPTDRYPAGVEIMREVARQLADVGIGIEVQGTPKDAFFSRVDSGRYQLLLYGWSCETIQAGEALDELIRTPPPGEGPNIEGFSDPRIDRLIDTANRESRIRDRSTLLGEALAAVAAARPVIPLAVQNETFAFSSERVAWNPSLDMALHIADVHAVPAARR